MNFDALTRPDLPTQAGVDEHTLRAMNWSGLIKLEQLLTLAAPASGGPWDEALAALRDFGPDRETVGALAAELSACLAQDSRATFDRPIAVAFTNPEDWDADDRAECGPRPVCPGVSNGMHRVAAALLAGATWIWVQDVTAGTRPVPDTDDEQLVVVTGRLVTTSESAVDVFDVAAWWLRSFRLTEEVWVESDACSVTNGRYEWLFYCPHPLAGALAATLVRRAAAHGVRLDVDRVVATTWGELDNEPDA